MLDLELLQPDQFRRVYEWDNAAEIECIERYTERLSMPNWTHYAINDDGAFIGCVSLELYDAFSCGLHLCMQPGAARLSELKRLLLAIGDMLFKSGLRDIYAEIKPENRAARLLAAMCGMRPNGSDFEYRRFRLTSKEFYGAP